MKESQSRIMNDPQTTGILLIIVWVRHLGRASAGKLSVTAVRCFLGQQAQGLDIQDAHSHGSWWQLLPGSSDRLSEHLHDASPGWQFLTPCRAPPRACIMGEPGRSYRAYPHPALRVLRWHFPHILLGTRESEPSLNHGEGK